LEKNYRGRATAAGGILWDWTRKGRMLDQLDAGGIAGAMEGPGESAVAER